MLTLLALPATKLDFDPIENFFVGTCSYNSQSSPMFMVRMADPVEDRQHMYLCLSSDDDSRSATTASERRAAAQLLAPTPQPPVTSRPLSGAPTTPTPTDIATTALLTIPSAAALAAPITGLETGPLPTARLPIARLDDPATNSAHSNKPPRQKRRTLSELSRPHTCMHCRKRYEAIRSLKHHLRKKHEGKGVELLDANVAIEERRQERVRKAHYTQQHQQACSSSSSPQNQQQCGLIDSPLLGSGGTVASGGCSSSVVSSSTPGPSSPTTTTAAAVGSSLWTASPIPHMITTTSAYIPDMSARAGCTASLQCPVTITSAAAQDFPAELDSSKTMTSSATTTTTAPAPSFEFSLAAPQPAATSAPAVPQQPAPIFTIPTMGAPTSPRSSCGMTQTMTEFLVAPLSWGEPETSCNAPSAMLATSGGDVAGAFSVPALTTAHQTQQHGTLVSTPTACTSTTGMCLATPLFATGSSFYMATQTPSSLMHQHQQQQQQQPGQLLQPRPTPDRTVTPSAPGTFATTAAMEQQFGMQAYPSGADATNVPVYALLQSPFSTPISQRHSSSALSSYASTPVQIATMYTPTTADAPATHHTSTASDFSGYFQQRDSTNLPAGIQLVSPSTTPTLPLTAPFSPHQMDWSNQTMAISQQQHPQQQQEQQQINQQMQLDQQIFGQTSIGAGEASLYFSQQTPQPQRALSSPAVLQPSPTVPYITPAATTPTTGFGTSILATGSGRAMPSLVLGGNTGEGYAGGLLGESVGTGASVFVQTAPQMHTTDMTPTAICNDSGNTRTNLLLQFPTLAAANSTMLSSSSPGLPPTFHITSIGANTGLARDIATTTMASAGMVGLGQQQQYMGVFSTAPAGSIGAKRTSSVNETTAPPAPNSGAGGQPSAKALENIVSELRRYASTDSHMQTDMSR